MIVYRLIRKGHSNASFRCAGWTPNGGQLWGYKAMETDTTGTEAVMIDTSHVDQLLADGLVEAVDSESLYIHPLVWYALTGE